MKAFIVLFVSVCCLFVGLKAAAVEPVVTELPKDNAQHSATESVLPINEECIQPKETGRCFALFYRFAYDMEKRECVEFIYGGCAGNTNNFETKEDCEQKCFENKLSSAVSDSEEGNTTAMPLSESEITTEKSIPIQN